MTKNISIANLASMTILSLACATGCSLELGEMKDLEWGDSSEETGASGGGGSSSGGGGGNSGGGGSAGGGGGTSSSATVPVDGTMYESGTKILLSESGINFLIPEGLYGMGDESSFDMGADGWAGMVSIGGVSDTRDDLDPYIATTMDMGAGEYWVPVGDVLLYDDATVVEYLIEGSVDGATHAAIIAVYGDTGVTALIIGMGLESTIDDVIYASELVGTSVSFDTTTD